MTELSRLIIRRTRGAYAVLYRKARPVVVSLEQGDLLRFREAGRRKSWTLPIDTAFRHAVHVAALAAAAEKRKRRGSVAR